MGPPSQWRVLACYFHLSTLGHAVFEQTCAGFFFLRWTLQRLSAWKTRSLCPWLFAHVYNIAPQIPLSWGCLQVSLRHRWLQLAETTLFPRLSAALAQGGLCQYCLVELSCWNIAKDSIAHLRSIRHKSFPSISELDAPSLWVAAFSPGKWHHGAFIPAGLMPQGLGSRRGGDGQGAVGCPQPSGSPWDTSGGLGNCGQRGTDVFPLSQGRSERAQCSGIGSAWALLMSCVCTAQCPTGFSENLPSLFVSPVRHTWVYTSSFSWEQAVIC